MRSTVFPAWVLLEFGSLARFEVERRLSYLGDAVFCPGVSVARWMSTMLFRPLSLIFIVCALTPISKSGIFVSSINLLYASAAII